MDKRQLSERDICTKFITPAIRQAGWPQHQFREVVSLTDGRVMVSVVARWCLLLRNDPQLSRLVG